MYMTDNNSIALAEQEVYTYTPSLSLASLRVVAPTREKTSWRPTCGWNRKRCRPPV